MAMRDQWTELYGPAHNLTGPTMMRPSSSLADSTTVTTSSGAGYAGSVNSPSSPGNIIEGRIGKSAKRRSRASRRAPVTLLNTDTSNFRAMVQQFTGIPSGPYSTGSLPGNAGGPGRPGMNFGLDFNVPLRANGGVMSFGQLQQPQQYQRPSFQEQSYSSQQQYMHGANMFTPGEYNNSGSNNDNNDLFGFNNDGIFLDGMTSRMMSKASSATNNRSEGYFE